MTQMLYIYGINPKRWASRFGIEPITAPCQNCGKLIETTLPLIFESFRGLAIDCSCGSHVPYCFVHVTGNLFQQSL